MPEKSKVKPSERIKFLIQTDPSTPRNYALTSGDWIKYIIDYLDEQWEASNGER